MQQRDARKFHYYDAVPLFISVNTLNTIEAHCRARRMHLGRICYGSRITRRMGSEAFTEVHARDEVRRCAGTQFDPGVVDAFLAVLDNPAAEHADDDSWAECLVLPGLADRQLLRRAPLAPAARPATERHLSRSARGARR
jgi:hypothetical protein